MGNRWGNSGNSERLLRGSGEVAPNSLQMVTAAVELKDAYSLEEKYDQPRHTLKSRAGKGLSSQS